MEGEIGAAHLPLRDCFSPTYQELLQLADGSADAGQNRKINSSAGTAAPLALAPRLTSGANLPTCS
jgi:hypothetical protein